jgi:hypothetical protein
MEAGEDVQQMLHHTANHMEYLGTVSTSYHLLMQGAKCSAKHAADGPTTLA